MAVSLSPNQFLLSALTLAWLLGFGFLRRGWNWRQCVGAALVALPFVRLAVNASIALPMVGTGAGAVPIAADDLWQGLGEAVVYHLVVPMTGLLLVFHPDPSGAWRAAARFLNLPRERLGQELLHAQGFFGLVAVVFFAAFLTTAQTLQKVLSSGRAGEPFAEITPVLALLVALAAGAGEEFLFRGILQRSLLRRLPWWAGILLASLAFGLAHAGIGGPANLVGPTALGLLLGLVALRLGLVAAILVHAEFDLAYFLLLNPDPLLAGAAALLAGASVGALVYTRGEALRRFFRPLPAFGARGDAREGLPARDER